MRVIDHSLSRSSKLTSPLTPLRRRGEKTQNEIPIPGVDTPGYKHVTPMG